LLRFSGGCAVGWFSNEELAQPDGDHHRYRYRFAFAPVALHPIVFDFVFFSTASVPAFGICGPVIQRVTPRGEVNQPTRNYEHNVTLNSITLLFSSSLSSGYSMFNGARLHEQMQ